MDFLIEVCVVEPSHSMSEEVAAQNWKLGDFVDIRGIKPALAIQNAQGIYVPKHVVTMRRSRYIFIKAGPDVGIAKLREVFCAEEVHALDESVRLYKRAWKFDLPPGQLNVLLHQGYITLPFAAFYAQAIHKRQGRVFNMDDLNGPA